MAADAAFPAEQSSAQPAEGLAGDLGGREERKETIFGTSKKYLRKASCSVIHLQGRGLFCITTGGLCVLTRVYMYTARAVYGVHTHGDAVCTPGHTPLCSPAACLGAQGHSLACGTAPPKKIQGSCHPGVRRGQDGAEPAPGAVQGAGAALPPPWGCTVLAEPVPWREGGSATSRVEPRAPVTSSAAGQRLNS